MESENNAKIFWFQLHMKIDLKIYFNLQNGIWLDIFSSFKPLGNDMPGLIRTVGSSKLRKKENIDEFYKVLVLVESGSRVFDEAVYS